SVATGRDKCGRNARIPRRINRNRRRNFSDAGSPFLAVGSYSSSSRRFGAIYLGELDRRAGRLLHKSPYHPFTWIHSRSGSNHRRHHRLPSREQALGGARNFPLSRDGADYRRDQIDLHEVEEISLTRGFSQVTTTASLAAAVSTASHRSVSH